MPRLPSGCMVGIRNNRMSYYLSMRDISAARLKKFRDVFPLIDVIFYRSRNTYDWYYSGFTLGTIKSEMKSWVMKIMSHSAHG